MALNCGGVLVLGSAKVHGGDVFQTAAPFLGSSSRRGDGSSLAGSGCSGVVLF